MDRAAPDRPLRVRFAPAAGRTLSLGAARTALFNWLLARRSGGAFVLLIDDTQTGAADEDAILRDLHWLGLDPDEGPASGAHGPYRRSERAALHREQVQRLIDAGSAYERDGAVWFRTPPGTTMVHDAIKGDVVFDHDGIADFVIRKANGEATYVLAAAVDDAATHIDLVLRGEEHLDGTPRHIMIARALGFEPPRYAHVGAVVDHHHRPLGADAPGVDDLRRAGFLPEAVISHLALLGWSAPDGRDAFTREDLIREFSLDRVGHSPSVSDEQRLRAFNARALRALPTGRYHALLAEAMQGAGLLQDPIPAAAQRWIDTFIEAFGDEVHTLGEALDAVAKLRAESTVVPALELERLRTRQVLFFLDAVSQYVDDQPELRGLPLMHDLPEIAKEFGLEKADALGAVRMALTGSREGPPLTLLFPLLGHDRIMMRIGAVSSHLLHGRGLEPIRYGPGGVPFETIHATPPSQATGHATEGS